MSTDTWIDGPVTICLDTFICYLVFNSFLFLSHTFTFITKAVEFGKWICIQQVHSTGESMHLKHCFMWKNQNSCNYLWQVVISQGGSLQVMGAAAGISDKCNTAGGAGGIVQIIADRIAIRPQAINVRSGEDSHRCSSTVPAQAGLIEIYSKFTTPCCIRLQLMNRRILIELSTARWYLGYLDFWCVAVQRNFHVRYRIFVLVET